jgi:hypothetical protein
LFRSGSGLEPGYPVMRPQEIERSECGSPEESASPADGEYRDRQWHAALSQRCPDTKFAKRTIGRKVSIPEPAGQNSAVSAGSESNGVATRFENSMRTPASRNAPCGLHQAVKASRVCESLGPGPLIIVSRYEQSKTPSSMPNRAIISCCFHAGRRLRA